MQIMQCITYSYIRLENVNETLKENHQDSKGFIFFMSGSGALLLEILGHCWQYFFYYGYRVNLKQVGLAAWAKRRLSHLRVAGSSPSHGNLWKSQFLTYITVILLLQLYMYREQLNKKGKIVNWDEYVAPVKFCMIDGTTTGKSL